jgi:hypothetical protein
MRRILGAAIVCTGIVVVCVLAFSSCYTIPSPDCGFVCGAMGACPANYTCASDSVCHLNGTPATMTCATDAGGDAFDAPLVSPTVTSTTPADGATNVDRGTLILASFDQAIQPGTVNPSTFIVTIGGVNVPGVTEVSPDNMNASFMPDSQLPAGTVVAVMLTGNVSSMLGAPLVPISWSFTTIDNEPPTVASSNPLDMATAVPDTTTIVVTFSEPVTGVDTTSFAVAAPGPTPIAGTIAASGATYTFTPTAALPAASLITVSLSAAIVDLAGNPLVPVAFSFTTQ